MRTPDAQYMNNERCISYLTTLIKSSMAVRFQTPAQRERVYRWRRTRRALQHDQIKLRQEFGNKVHEPLISWLEDAHDAQAWFQRQLLAYMRERTENLCFEGVEPVSTPGTPGL